MKKLLLSLFVAASACLGINAADITISGPNLDGVGEGTSAYTQDGVTISRVGGSAPAKKSDYIKIYANNELTISSQSAAISKITLTGSNNSYISGKFTSTQEGVTIPSAITGTELVITVSPAQNSVTFKNTHSSQARITSIVITLEESTTCATPVITPDDGSKLYEQDAVSISTFTEGAEIYYTLNGDDPTAESLKYDAAAGITFSEDGAYTVKAIAVKEGLENSAVATATFTYATVRPEIVGWEMATAATLTDGIYVIAGNKNGVWKALGHDYNSANQTNFKAIDVTVEKNKLIEPSADVALVYLKKDADGNYTLEVTNATTDAGANFLTSASSSSNHMKMSDAQTPATITISETENTADIVFTGNYTHNTIRYNAGSTIFSCYTTGQEPIYLFKQPVEKPMTPDATVDGTSVSNEGTIDLKGSAKTIMFEGLAEGVNIWYKFEPAIAVTAEYTPEEGFSKYDAATGISLTQAGTLTYYAEKDGVVGDTHTITVEGTATGISEVEAAAAAATEWFDLSGRRVAAPAKGVYLRKQGAKITKIAY